MTLLLNIEEIEGEIRFVVQFLGRGMNFSSVPTNSMRKLTMLIRDFENPKPKPVVDKDQLALFEESFAA